MYDHYWNGCDAHSLLRQAILRRFQVLHNCSAYDGAGMLTRLRFWDHQISRLRPHGSVGRSGCLPYLFYLLDVDGILGGYIGVISACTVFIEWALGRDTLQRRYGVHRIRRNQSTDLGVTALNLHETPQKPLLSLESVDLLGH